MTIFFETAYPLDVFLVLHIGLYESLVCPMHVPTTCTLGDLVPHLGWPSASLLQLIHVKYSSSNGKGIAAPALSSLHSDGG